MSKRPVGNECPYCERPMAVTRMTCEHCQVSVEAAFPPARLSRLPVEHQRFIEMFVLASGSLKQIAEQTGVSYPTVRSRLDKVIEALRAEIAKAPASKEGAVDPTAADRLTPEQMARLIKSI